LPQVIAAWSGTPQDGHGHHQYSGVLAREVFDAAADSVRFRPSAVGGLPPWTTAKFYRARRTTGASLTFNVGEYDALLGRTYSEIATQSRSEHRSQGQGGLPQPGPRFDAVRLEVSRVSNTTAPGTRPVDRLDSQACRRRCAAVDSLPVAAAAGASGARPENPATIVTRRAVRSPRVTRRVGGGVRDAHLDGRTAGV
jgi:hypothetical protein